MAKRKAVVGSKIPTRRKTVQRKRQSKKKKAPSHQPSKRRAKKRPKKPQRAKKRAKKRTKRVRRLQRPVELNERILASIPRRPKKRKAPPKKPARKFYPKTPRLKKPVAPLPPEIIPKDWIQRPLSRFRTQDLERMASQVAQRIAEKIGQNGYTMDDVETPILLALIGAEQNGTLNREFYNQAGEYDGYDTAQEVYRLWIYS